MGSILRQVTRKIGIRVLSQSLAEVEFGRGGGSINCPKRNYSYQGDGKTTVTILNDEIDSPLMIDGYHHKGFRLNNGMTVVGPVAIFPKTVFAWDVGSVTDITPDSLALFGILAPKLDILVIGVGDAGNQIDPSVLRFLREKKIGFEILSTEHACQTFNFLSVEKRCVAGALIPPVKIIFYDDDVIEHRNRRRQLFQTQYDENPL
jgi:NADH dehydrogenase [ubiquinone] 1 alpha subcomplex assembly factor 3